MQQLVTHNKYNELIFRIQQLSFMAALYSQTLTLSFMENNSIKLLYIVPLCLNAIFKGFLLLLLDILLKTLVKV